MDSMGRVFGNLWRPMALESWPLNKKIADSQTAMFEACSTPGLEAWRLGGLGSIGVIGRRYWWAWWFAGSI